ARANTYTLHLHDQFVKEGFAVEACSFNVDHGLVLIKLYHDGAVVTMDALTGNESINYNDEINVTVVNVTGYEVAWCDEEDDPRACIEVCLRARPELQLSISTDEEEHYPEDNEIHAEVFLKNTGTCSIEDVNLDIKTGGMRTVSNLVRNFDEIGRYRSETIDIYLKIPHLMEKQSFELSATATGKSWDGEKHTISASKSITVSPCWKMLEIEKTVTESVYLHSDHLFDSYNNSNDSIASCASVNLTIFNPGLIDISCIELTDSLPENFVLEDGLDGSSLEWTLNLTPKEKKEFSYSMKPLSYGNYDVPVATGNWSLYGKKYSAVSISNQSQITVYAAHINLTKTVNQTEAICGEEVMVTVRLQNTGSLQATVDVSDIIPENVTLLGGITSLNGVTLDEDDTQRFSYRVRMNSTGEMVLPPAKASFTDLYGYEDSTVSGTVPVTVIDAAQNIETATRPVINDTLAPATKTVSAFVRRMFGFVFE
ncbi:MAG TPA: DUF11 domain-containing protein, partial [Methanosarcinales archaeon]|nr:DUF11 domain-containing protein [Methanosarcinales archaeon]